MVCVEGAALRGCRAPKFVPSWKAYEPETYRLKYLLEDASVRRKEYLLPSPAESGADVTPFFALVLLVVSAKRCKLCCKTVFFSSTRYPSGLQ